MEMRVAKELMHIRRWLSLAASIASRGRSAYESDEIAQEAGDSIMMKIGEAAKTLAARGVPAPPGISWSDAAKNREKLAHHYSVIDRNVTWQTLSVSLPKWEQALGPLFIEAEGVIDGESRSSE